MKLFNLLSPQKKTQLNRLRRTLVEGSPKYHYDLAAIVAGAQAYIDMPTLYPLSRKYQPLDTILIINNDAVGISLVFNSPQEPPFIIPAGVIRTIGKDEVPAIWNITVTNLDAAAAVTVNMIDFEIWKSPEEATDILRREWGQ